MSFWDKEIPTYFWLTCSEFLALEAAVKLDFEEIMLTAEEIMLSDVVWV